MKEIRKEIKNKEVKLLTATGSVRRATKEALAEMKSTKDKYIKQIANNYAAQAAAIQRQRPSSSSDSEDEEEEPSENDEEEPSEAADLRAKMTEKTRKASLMNQSLMSQSLSDLRNPPEELPELGPDHHDGDVENDGVKVEGAYGLNGE